MNLLTNKKINKSFKLELFYILYLNYVLLEIYILHIFF